VKDRGPGNKGGGQSNLSQGNKSGTEVWNSGAEEHFTKRRGVPAAAVKTTGGREIMRADKKVV